jgi:DNA-binding cell septation regulator SpoVG
MIIQEWRPFVRGGLRAFARVELDVGLVIPNIRILVGSKGPFAALPEQPVIKDGQVQRDDDDRPVYVPTVSWKDRATGDKFSSAVIKLLLAKYPNALGGG